MTPEVSSTLCLFVSLSLPCFWSFGCGIFRYPPTVAILPHKRHTRPSKAGHLLRQAADFQTFLESIGFADVILLGTKTELVMSYRQTDVLPSSF